jgi:hypothetical protein
MKIFSNTLRCVLTFLSRRLRILRLRHPRWVGYALLHQLQVPRSSAARTSPNRCASQVIVAALHSLQHVAVSRKQNPFLTAISKRYLLRFIVLTAHVTSQNLVYALYGLRTCTNSSAPYSIRPGTSTATSTTYTTTLAITTFTVCYQRCRSN